MYIAGSALEGGRKQRIFVGSLLGLLMLALTASLAGAASNNTRSPGVLVLFAAAALCAFGLVVWGFRFACSAFTEGRRPQPASQPSLWPWIPPLGVLAAAFIATGVRSAAQGDASGALFSFAFGGAALLPFVIAAVALIIGRRKGHPAPEAAPEQQPERPHRNWGPIG